MGMDISGGGWMKAGTRPPLMRHGYLVLWGHVDTIAAFPCCCVYLSGGVTILTTRGSLHVPRLVVVKYEREVHVSISTRTRKIARV